MSSSGPDRPRVILTLPIYLTKAVANTPKAGIRSPGPGFLCRVNDNARQLRPHTIPFLALPDPMRCMGQIESFTQPLAVRALPVAAAVNYTPLQYRSVPRSAG